jgi:hypothetical protein
MNTDVLPLAITMMAGPQILSAIIFVTAARDPIKLSAAFVIAVALATTLGTFVAEVLAGSISLRDGSEPKTAAKIIELSLVGLLVLAAIKSYLGRETAEPPKWLGKLQGIDPKGAFRFGVLLIFLMPSDIVIMLTVGIDLERNGLSLVDAIPFIAATAFIAALPMLFYLLFRKRARTVMPKFRDWMNNTSWLVNIIVYAIFIGLILA